MSSRVEIDADWRAAGLRYYAYSFFLRSRFGGRVHKVSLDAGMTCPNVDGTVARGGCTFCDNRSFSPSRRLPRQSIAEQLEEGMRRVGRWFGVDRFLAYFQPATNTYAPVDDCVRCTKRRSHIRKSSDWRSAPGPIACRTTCSICLSEIAGERISRSNMACKRSTTARWTG